MYIEENFMHRTNINIQKIEDEDALLIVSYWYETKMSVIKKHDKLFIETKKINKFHKLLRDERIKKIINDE